ncbi:EAL domain-containing protein [Rhizobium sullae]|uniref:EAL domain-containing protein n=1 Tax=Rhizobium sullae TaxID=50338 RepID=UPI000B3572A2|nr:EAL domain-containing protein [Rhizobium sullae]
MVDLDLLDERHVSIVQEAIAEDRIGFIVQSIHAIDDPAQVLYGECFPHLTDQDGIEHADAVFVPALEALGEAPVLDRHMLKLVLNALESNSLSVLGYSLSSDNVSDPGSWAHIRDQIAARPELASRLVLKFTGIQTFADAALAISSLSEARDLGCRIAIDDDLSWTGIICALTRKHWHSTTLCENGYITT